MPINSRAKGCCGEREAAKFLHDLLGCKARRGRQFSGSPDSPDVVDAIKGVHVEVKRSERIEIYKWMRQCQLDAGHEPVPMIMFRTNRQPWLITIPANSLLEFCQLVLTEWEKNQ